MINFVPEDGTGVAGANSYVTVEDADDIAEMLGVDAFTSLPSLDAKQKALIRATRYLDMNFTMPGMITLATQALGWPRLNAYDGENRLYDGVPQAIKEATVVLAGKATTAKLFRDAAAGGTPQLKRKKIGQLEQEFFQNDPSQAPYFGEVEALMRRVGGVFVGDGVTGFGQARVAR